MSNVNRSGTFVHVHAYGESEDPVTGRTVRTPIGTVEVGPNEEFPDWAEPGTDYDEALLEAPETAADRAAAGVGAFPFDLDRAEQVRKAQEEQDKANQRRADNAAQVAQAMESQRKVDLSPEKSTANSASDKTKAGGR